jgi:hypothetical protein
MKEQMKAIVAGAVAGLAFAIPVVDDGLVASEILGIALAVLTGHQAVYWTKNKQATP